MKLLFLIFTVIILGSCGSDTSQKEVPSITISTNSQTHDQLIAVESDLTLSGNNNGVRIQDGSLINKLSITGDSNAVLFGSGVTVNTFGVSGINNYIDISSSNHIEISGITAEGTIIVSSISL